MTDTGAENAALVPPAVVTEIGATPLRTHGAVNVICVGDTLSTVTGTPRTTNALALAVAAKRLPVSMVVVPGISVVGAIDVRIGP